MREATAYRNELLGEYCDLVLPIVTGDLNTNRLGWGVDTLSLALLEAIDPTKQLRLARFLHDRDTQIVAAAQIIDRYTLQMTTTQGLTQLHQKSRASVYLHPHHWLASTSPNPRRTNSGGTVTRRHR